MQELISYAGQLECYGECNEVLRKFLSVEVSVMQVHRVTDTYGHLLEQQVAAGEPSEEVMSIKANESVYAGDGWINDFNEGRWL